MAVNYWGKGAIELHYADCEHTFFIPRGHSADHQHCYACHPELVKEPLPGCCERCRPPKVENQQRECFAIQLEAAVGGT